VGLGLEGGDGVWVVFEVIGCRVWVFCVVEAISVLLGGRLGVVWGGGVFVGVGVVSGWVCGGSGVIFLGRVRGGVVW